MTVFRGSLPVLLLLFFVVALEAAPTPFTVRRNVRDYGAVGDGTHDDTAAFIAALTEGKATTNNTGPWDNSQYNCQTTMPSIVLIPPGTYILSAQLPLTYYTQVVGDYRNRPRLKFIKGPYVCMDAGPDQGQGNGWYGGLNQNNFFHQFRNAIVDLTSCFDCTAIHWQVAKATSITNTDFELCDTCKGIYAESGGGGYLGDLMIRGGSEAITMGSQQYTVRNVTIIGSKSGIDLIWGWMWSFFDVTLVNVSTAITLVTADSAIFTDVTIQNSAFGVIVKSFYTQFLLDNIEYVNVTNPLIIWQFYENQTSRSYFNGNRGDGSNYTGPVVLPDRSPKLIDTASGRYRGMSRPYYDSSITMVLQLSNGTDVTQQLQSQLMQAASSNKAAFLPFGTYYLSDTVILPPGTRLYGECWSRLLATGPVFANRSVPTPMLLVRDDAAGLVQMSDLLLGVFGPAEGAVLVEWGGTCPPSLACGMWDVHFRIGGGVGTGFEPSACPTKSTYSASPQCGGAHTLLHVTQTASGVYLENVWGWVGDHDIDAGQPINIYNARGMLLESQKGPIWMYGTAMEHSFLFQYNFAAGTSEVLSTVMQSETPYYQPEFSLVPFATERTDPPFSFSSQEVQTAYGLAVQRPGENVAIYGTALYSFFNRWNDQCAKDRWNTSFNPCQDNMIFLQDVGTVGVELPTVGAPKGFQFHIVNAHGSRNFFDVMNNGTHVAVEGTHFPNDICQTMTTWEGQGG